MLTSDELEEMNEETECICSDKGSKWHSSNCMSNQLSVERGQRRKLIEALERSQEALKIMVERFYEDDLNGDMINSEKLDIMKAAILPKRKEE